MQDMGLNFWIIKFASLTESASIKRGLPVRGVRLGFSCCIPLVPVGLQTEDSIRKY